MRHLTSIPFAVAFFASAAHSQSAAAPPASDEFVLHKTEHKEPKKPSKIKATETEAAVKLSVVEKKTGAGIPAVLVCFKAPSGKKYYASETDADGDAELLVPINQTYEITYLSLAKSEVTAKAVVDGTPNHNLHLTLRYERHRAGREAPPTVLDGLLFDTGKAEIRLESLPRLDSVAEYMTHKLSMKIEITGHTDNVGNAKDNKDLSLRRAQSCRDYLVSKGVDAARIMAIGKGEEMPVASNQTEDGRQQNRRIEAIEL